MSDAIFQGARPPQLAAVLLSQYTGGSIAGGQGTAANTGSGGDLWRLYGAGAGTGLSLRGPGRLDRYHPEHWHRRPPDECRSLELVVMIEPNRVRMAMYQSADGPRIMLFGPMEADFASLQSCFRQLKEKRVAIQLDSMPWIEASGNMTLRLESAASIFNAGQHVQGLRRQDSGRSFVWTRTAEGWDYLDALVDGLVKDMAPGHQYLTRYPDEDAIVVVSKGEYSDDVLRNG